MQEKHAQVSQFVLSLKLCSYASFHLSQKSCSEPQERAEPGIQYLPMRLCLNNSNQSLKLLDYYVYDLNA